MGVDPKLVERPHLQTSDSHSKPPPTSSQLTMASNADYKDRQFLAVIGDEDSVTGLLLAGIGHVTAGADAEKNFLIVDGKTETAAIETAFDRFTEERKDIGIVLINQHVSSAPDLSILCNGTNVPPGRRQDTTPY